MKELEDLISAFQAKDYEVVIHKCIEMDLEASSHDTYVQNNIFYCIFMASYAILDKYDCCFSLWSRISPSVKLTASELHIFHALATQMNSFSLVELKQSFLHKYPFSIQFIVDAMLYSWRSEQRYMISTAYKSITTSNYAKIMLLEDNEVLEDIRQFQWNYSEVSGCIYPNANILMPSYLNRIASNNFEGPLKLNDLTKFVTSWEKSIDAIDVSTI